MPAKVNLQHLEKKHLRLQGEVSVEELELEGVDELIHAEQPATYDLEAQKSSGNLLLQGNLRITLRCECARCLQPYDHELSWDAWTCHVPLEGEESAPVHNDCVDLTPYIREDIVLAFPQHPLCGADCQGLKQTSPQSGSLAVDKNQADGSASFWSELDKLNL